MPYIQNFMLGTWNPESDHRALCIDLSWTRETKHAMHNPDGHPTHLCMDYKRAPQYASMVASAVWKALHALGIDASLAKQWEAFKDIINVCAEKCFAKKRMGRHVHRHRNRKGWFDMECQLARAHLTTIDAHLEKEKYHAYALEYRTLTRCKRRRWEVNDNVKKVREKARESGKFWREFIKRKAPEPLGKLTLTDMYAHCKKLYSQRDAGYMPQTGPLSCTPSFFTIVDISSGLKKMSIGKAGDLQGLKPEMLKWTGEKKCMDGFAQCSTWHYNMACHMIGPQIG